MSLADVKTPVIAELMTNSKIYGPFANGLEALEWHKQQPEGVRIVFRALRNPNVDRTYEEFYLPDYLEDESREFDVQSGNVVFKTLTQFLRQLKPANIF